MGYAAEEGREEPPSLSVNEDGWYFLRRDVSIRGKRYRAGTLVEHVHGEWFVQSAASDAAGFEGCAGLIDASMVCKTSYGDVSLYEVWRVRDDLVYARPVLSDVSPQSVDPMTLNVALASGQSRICVRFGRCFLPPEFFNW